MRGGLAVCVRCGAVAKGRGAGSSSALGEEGGSGVGWVGSAGLGRSVERESGKGGKSGNLEDELYTPPPAPHPPSPPPQVCAWSKHADVEAADVTDVYAQLHARYAPQALALMLDLRGFYIKFGQVKHRHKSPLPTTPVGARVTGLLYQAWAGTGSKTPALAYARLPSPPHTLSFPPPSHPLPHRAAINAEASQHCPHSPPPPPPTPPTRPPPLPHPHRSSLCCR